MTTSVYERRLLAEWERLRALAECNPGRLTETTLHDGAIALRLLHTPARLLDGAISEQHAVTIGFPLHYPAVPMTMHLAQAVEHPNVHPATGFVCLWADHRTSNTVEHALHKLVAMMAGKLFNADPIHVMQPAALQRLQAGEEFSSFAPLQGVDFSHTVLDTPAPRRRRFL